MNVRSGITSKTPENVFIDAGAVYFNYGLADERLLGATRGGNEFNTNRASKNIEVDGAKGKVKGLERITEVNPQITVNMLELSIDNLIKAIAGANQTDLINIDVEHVGAGNGGTKEFSFLHGFTVDASNIVENSERVYVQKTSAAGPMLLQTRSKKYDSRFVGANRVTNKSFETGVGGWSKGHNDDDISIVTGGQSRNCLAYEGSGSSVVKFLRLPGSNGAILTNLVSGEHYRLQMAVKKSGTWNAGDVTITCDDGTVTVTLTTAWVMVVIEFTASGTDAEIALEATTPAASDIMYIDSVELEKVDTPAGSGQLGYVINWVEGKVYLASAPTADYDVIVSYTYTTSSAVDTTITGGEIEDSDYIENVAIVGNVSGKTYPVICIVKNALAEGPFSLSTAPRDEAVPVVVFTGHYLPDDLDSEPWKVRYPKT